MVISPYLLCIYLLFASTSLLTGQVDSLEPPYNETTYNLALKKSHNELVAVLENIEWMILAIAIILLALLVILWQWKKQKTMHREIAENRKHLHIITKLLEENNQVVGVMKEANVVTMALKPSEENDFIGVDLEKGSLELPSHSILTSTDWADFKLSFNNNYPDFINRLRTAFPELTESEERLFLLIKLRLNTKEISNVLGISASSVKKTRNRLRKKLPLSIDDKLNTFIHHF